MYKYIRRKYEKGGIISPLPCIGSFQSISVSTEPSGASSTSRRIPSRSAERDGEDARPPWTVYTRLGGMRGQCVR